jgi:phenylpropionate dioxygenase-like ring-hydroxylating dioxygenase large terminal subunit
MLTKEENELLTRTGPGTPMGQLFRRFWIPALLSEELISPDSPPVRVQLLGEKLIAFRDSNGTVGLIDRYCSHRGADLFYGRNEEGGLRCVYHGWKFDREGQCLDVPNAVVGQAFRDKCRLTAYPTIEKGGMIWAYMGPPDKMPELPHYGFFDAPDANYFVTKFKAHGNYLQSLEGECDSGHVSFLHRFVNQEGVSAASSGGLPFVSRVAHVHWELEQTDYGIMMAAQRDLGDGRANWRANLFLMPHTVPIATVRGVTMTCHIRVPIDDESSWLYRPRWNPSRPLTSAELAEFRTAGEDYPELLPASYIPKENNSNDYLIDRAMQRRFNFTGIKSLAAQDMAVQSDQAGVIADRTRENLVSADRAVLVMRQRLLKAARDLQAGKEPPETTRPEAFNVRAMDIVIAKDADWHTEMKAAMSLDLPWTETPASKGEVSLP